MKLLISCVLFSSSLAQAQIRYVDSSASPGGNGLAWATAYRTLQDALAAATLGGVTQIWIRDVGTYVPGPNRADTFQMVSGVSLYGGFVGTETALSQRNPSARSTLDGEGVYHVVTALSDVTTVVTLDQLIITGGYNDGTIQPDGAGIYAPAFTMGPAAKLALNRCRITQNLTTGGNGAAIFVNLGDISIDNSYIDRNFCGGGSGAVVISDPDSGLVNISNTTFHRNNNEFELGALLCVAGGALFLSVIQQVTIDNCIFEENSSGTFCGSHGGAIYLVNAECTISDSEFIGNLANASGGAIATDSALEMTGCSFNDNNSGGSGGAIVSGRALVAENCEFVNCDAGVEPTLNPLFCTTSSFGGAIHVANGTAAVRGSSFENCSAGIGGAISGHIEEITDCVFEGNSTLRRGGAVAVISTLAAFENVTFINNTAKGQVTEAECRGGGAVYLPDTDAGYLFVNCRFSGNIAGDSTVSAPDPRLDARGGAVRSHANDVRFQNCVFNHNQATGEGGAIAADGDASAVLIDSCTFGMNGTSMCGAAISSGGSLIENSIIWGNVAGGSCSGTSQLSGTGNVYYGILQQVGGTNPPGWGFTSVLNSDPIFKNTGTPTVASANLRVSVCSPAINAGSNALLPLDELDLDGDSNTSETIPFDLDFRQRIRASIVNLGAYENCPADIDDSGSITGNDSIAFLNLYNSGSPQANFDCSTGSPLLTANDFSAFLTALANGCS